MLRFPRPTPWLSQEVWRFWLLRCVFAILVCRRSPICSPIHIRYLNTRTDANCHSVLALLFFVCSHWRMERLTLPFLSEVILNSPAWARVGLTLRDDRVRLRAADALAATIIQRVNEPDEIDGNQLVFPL